MGTNELNKSLFGGRRVIGVFPHFHKQVVEKDSDRSAASRLAWDSRRRSESTPDRGSVESKVAEVLTSANASNRDSAEASRAVSENPSGKAAHGAWWWAKGFSEDVSEATAQFSSSSHAKSASAKDKKELSDIQTQISKLTNVKLVEAVSVSGARHPDDIPNDEDFKQNASKFQEKLDSFLGGVRGQLDRLHGVISRVLTSEKSIPDEESRTILKALGRIGSA
jgi:hypothetical protein